MSLQCTTLAPVWFGCTGLGWAGLDGAITVVFDVWMMVDCMFKFDFDFLPLFSLSEPLCAVYHGKISKIHICIYPLTLYHTFHGNIKLQVLVYNT